MSDERQWEVFSSLGCFCDCVYLWSPLLVLTMEVKTCMWMIK